MDLYFKKYFFHHPISFSSTFGNTFFFRLKISEYIFVRWLTSVTDAVYKLAPPTLLFLLHSLTLKPKA